MTHGGLAAHSMRATAALCAAAGIAAVYAPASVTALLLAYAFVPYGLLVAARPDALDPKHALWLAAAAALALVCAPPVLSDDVFRYLWDGRVLRHGVDPYHYAPADPALASLRDVFWERVNHRHIPTIYPPLAQLTFALLGAIWHSPYTVKLAMALCHLGVAAALVRAGYRRGGALLALNPLALSESALGGHLDIAVGGALLAAVLAMERSRAVVASLWLAMASGLKMIGLLLTPLVGHERRAQTVLAVGLSAAVLAPQFALRPQHEAPGGAAHYARRWQGNAGGFALVEAATRAGLRALASPEERAHDHIRLSSLAGVLERLSGTPLDPWRAVRTEKKEVPDRTDFAIPFLASLLARLGVAALLAVAAWVAWWKRAPVLQAARWLLLGALWLAPQVHPWYLLWLLPLECVAGGLAGLVWSAAVLTAYAPLDLWQNARVWHESIMIQAMEFAIVALAFAAEPWLLRGARGVRTPPTPPAESTGPAAP